MRCPDPPVHPAASSVLRGPLRALGVLAALALCGWAVTALAPLWAALLLAEAVLAVAGIWALQRRVRYWGWRKPVKREAVNHTVIQADLVRAPYQIPAPPLMVEAPVTVNGRSVSAAVLPPAAARTATGTERRAQA